METLYDLLGALPQDDAGELRAAFRRAVKGAHPDLNPGDPDAGWKFRRIVRANEILGDAEQRAVYDHLLELAEREQRDAARQTAASKVYKIASGVMALTALSAAALSCYVLFLQLPAPSMTPAESGVPAARLAAGANSPETSAPAETLALAVVPNATAEPATDAQSGNIGPPLDITPSGEKYHRASSASRGSAPNPPASSDQASASAPKPAPPTNRGGTLLYRLHQFERAFADIGGETKGRPHGVASARKKSPRQAAEADLSRQEGFPFTQP